MKPAQPAESNWLKALQRLSHLSLEYGNKNASRAPVPIGANWDGVGVNFAIFSERAERIELCLFDSDTEKEVERITLPERTTYVWHGYIHGMQPGQLYGYRVHGPFQPEEGLAFNPNKLLIDPYAKALAGQVNWTRPSFSRTNLVTKTRDLDVG